MREPTTQTAIRLADRLLARIDRHRKRMERAAGPRVEATTADAIRDLLERGLAAAEAEERAASEGGES